MDGYIYGQPLYLANVTIPQKGIHNVVYVATEHDSRVRVRRGHQRGRQRAPLWQVSFINPGAGVTTVPYQDTGCDQIVPELGITSTPVIDPAERHHLRGRDDQGDLRRRNYLCTPPARAGCLDRRGEAGKPGGDSGDPFRAPARAAPQWCSAPKNYKQRPGLLLLNGVVYTAWSSHCDIGPYHGWLIGYDAKTLSQIAVYNNTPNGNEGFLLGRRRGAGGGRRRQHLRGGRQRHFRLRRRTGPDLGESYIKLSTSGGLAVADYFTPFNLRQPESTAIWTWVRPAWPCWRTRPGRASIRT